MAINHGNPLTTAICPVLWQYGVPHTEVNGPEYGRGENREGNGVGNGRGRPMGTETDREQKKGSQTGAMRPTGFGRENMTVGGERGGVPGVLRGRGC